MEKEVCWPTLLRKHLTVSSTHCRKQELEPTTLMRRKPITFHKSLQWTEAGKHNQLVEITELWEEDALKCKGHILGPCFGIYIKMISHIQWRVIYVCRFRGFLWTVMIVVYCKSCLVWTWYVEHSRYGYSKWTYKVIVKLRTKKSGNQCCGHFSECH